MQLRRATSASLADQQAELTAICRLLEVARARRYFQGASNLDVMARAKELAERCGERDVLIDLLWFEWSALATSCRGEEAAPLAMELRRLTADDPRPEVRATGHQIYGVLCWGAGRITEAVEHLDIAIDLMAQAGPPADAFAMERTMVATTFWIWCHTVHGDFSPEEAFARYDDLIAAMPDRFAVASICGFAATTAVTVGRWDETERFAGIGIEAGAGGQFAFWDGMALMHRGLVLAGQGRVEEAIASFAEGQARYTGIGARSAVATFQATLALQLARPGPHRRRRAVGPGRPDRAGHLQRALERAHRPHGRGGGGRRRTATPRRRPSSTPAPPTPPPSRAPTPWPSGPAPSNWLQLAANRRVTAARTVRGRLASSCRRARTR